MSEEKKQELPSYSWKEIKSVFIRCLFLFCASLRFIRKCVPLFRVLALVQDTSQKQATWADCMLSWWLWYFWRHFQNSVQRKAVLVPTLLLKNTVEEADIRPSLGFRVPVLVSIPDSCEHHPSKLSAWAVLWDPQCRTRQEKIKSLTT